MGGRTLQGRPILLRLLLGRLGGGIRTAKNPDCTDEGAIPGLAGLELDEDPMRLSPVVDGTNLFGLIGLNVAAAISQNLHAVSIADLPKIAEEERAIGHTELGEIELGNGSLEHREELESRMRALDEGVPFDFCATLAFQHRLLDGRRRNRSRAVVRGASRTQRSEQTDEGTDAPSSGDLSARRRGV
jgi:hypothetical protein